jgi:glutathione S-transferase
MKLYCLPGASSLFPHIVLQRQNLTQGSHSSVVTTVVQGSWCVADRVPEGKLAPANGSLALAKLQSWLNFTASERQLGCFCRLFDREIPPAVKAIFRRRLESRLAHVERHLRRQPYLLGDDFSIADVYLLVVSNWARSVERDLSAYPGVLALPKRVGARPATREAMRREDLLP